MESDRAKESGEYIRELLITIFSHTFLSLPKAYSVLENNTWYAYVHRNPHRRASRYRHSCSFVSLAKCELSIFLSYLALRCLNMRKKCWIPSSRGSSHLAYMIALALKCSYVHQRSRTSAHYFRCTWSDSRMFLHIQFQGAISERAFVTLIQTPLIVVVLGWTRKHTARSCNRPNTLIRAQIGMHPMTNEHNRKRYRAAYKTLTIWRA